jgi:peptide methionine sulfoxide reductase msrA/msrB
MNAFIDKIASLTPEERHIISDKGTEKPHTGAYNDVVTKGTYLCRRCGIALFQAYSQFTASCGWPSFDESIQQTVKQQADSDGRRTEIVCRRCDGHLGHVFTGENYTIKNTRYCVNSLSIDFVEDRFVADTQEAIVAGGCFWGVDYYLRRVPGVLKVEVGYTGGKTDYPTYERVCQGNTKHFEAVRVIFDSDRTNYCNVLRGFFEIHDPTQSNGQGPDIGQQYQSAVFYYNNDQYAQATDLIQSLRQNNCEAVTQLLPVKIFWPAEEDHQNYYAKHNKTPYCHQPVTRFK